MCRQNGFTLVELICVVIILGVLSATALPKFLDIKSNAEIAVTKELAGRISGWGTTNFMAFKLGKPIVTSGQGVYAINNATNACSDLSSGSLYLALTATGSNAVSGNLTYTPSNNSLTPPTEFQISPVGPLSVCAAGVVIKCVVMHKYGHLAYAYIPCTL